MTDAPATNPSPARQRSGHGAIRTRKSKAWPARTIAPAEQPASTAPRSWASASARPTALPSSTSHQVGRLAARQVDEVGLADRLGGGRVVGGGAVADQDGLDLGAELTEMGDAHRRPADEDLLAVGIRGRRQDRDARPGAAGRGQQAGVELGHRGEELTGADERHGSGHGGESTRTLPEPRRRCDTGPT